MNILEKLRNQFRPAVTNLFASPDVMLDIVCPAQDPKFGDYQANFAMPLAKKLGTNPVILAGQIVQLIDFGDACHEPVIAGPGFINLKLKNE